MTYLKATVLISLFTFSVSYSFSQLGITGQYKTRGEFANGYQQPLMDSDLPSFYVAQRTRLGAYYTHERFKFEFTIQDVRTWGNTSNIAIDNKGFLSVYEANLSLYLNKKWSTKIGRQPISYDNDRIFGSLDWAMQARRHDALIVKFSDNGWSIDLGATYNNERSSNNHIIYELNNYKTFQYVWANKEWEEFSVSVLFLNNGMERIYFQDSVKKGAIMYSQTFGTHLEYKKEKIDITGFGYFQTGKDKTNNNINAYNASIEGTYKPNDKWKISLGGELLSGSSQELNADNTNRSFSPLYGTNHKFNGYMDYFYVGNHEKNVGLIDGYLKGGFKVGKFTFGLANHFFFAAAPVITESGPINPEVIQMDPFLGYEADFTIKYQFIDEIAIELGYSQFFDTSTLREVKGTGNQKTNNWTYLMLTAKPFKNFKLFK